MNNATIQLPKTVPQQAGSNLTLIVIAILMGLAAAGVNLWYISSVRSEAAAHTFTVYKLNRNVEPGYTLRIDRDLIPTQVPKQFDDSLFDVIKNDAIKAQADQKVARAAKAGEVVTYGLFTGGGSLLDSKISPGKRGCPLPINSRTAPGLLRPGMYVDISADFTVPGTKSPQNKVIIERVPVRAVGSNTDETGKTHSGGYSSITIEVDPPVAEQLLTIAKAVGRDGFDVLIRNPGDEHINEVNIHKDVLQLVGLEK